MTRTVLTALNLSLFFKRIISVNVITKCGNPDVNTVSTVKAVDCKKSIKNRI